MKRFLILTMSLVIILSLILAGCSSTPTPSTSAPATTSAPTTSAAPTTAKPTTTTSAPTTSAAPTTAKPTTTTAAPTTTAANVIKLKYADQNPDVGWEGTQAAQPWLKQITDATNGRVQFETYWNQSLFKGTDAWVSVKNGVGDLAWMFQGYWANQNPLSDVLSLPFMPFTSAKQASGIFWQLYEKYPNLRDRI